MTRLGKTLAALIATGALAAPAAGQYYPPPQPYPQPYPQNYPPGYYPQQPYGNQGGIGAIIDQLLGNRYNVTDRSAVSRCASAAMQQAQARYTPYGYGQNYGQNYGQGYRGMRVTAITSVERRSNGLRVRGLLDSGRGGYGYQGQGYGAQGYGDLTFRCTVDYRGYVSNIKIDRNTAYRRY